MQIIDNNVDSFSGQKYYLCKMKFGELREQVKNSLGNINLNDFNEAYNEKVEEEIKIDVSREAYDEHLKDANYYGEKPSFEKWSKRKLEWDTKQHSENLSSAKTGDKEKMLLFDIGTENNFISIHVKSIDDFGKITLLDGFRRVLFDTHYLEKNLEKEVYVKVYTGEISNETFLKIMFENNVWKLSSSHDIHVFFDRGYRLFLYGLTGIFLSTESAYQEGREDHFDLLRRYWIGTNTSWFSILKAMKIFTSPVFLDDLKLIDELTKKNLISSRSNDTFCDMLMEELGRERLSGNFKTIGFNDIKDYLEINNKEKEHLEKMCVSGFIENRSKPFIRYFMKIFREGNLYTSKYSAKVVKEFPRGMTKTEAQ